MYLHIRTHPYNKEKLGDAVYTYLNRDPNIFYINFPKLDIKYDESLPIFLNSRI